MVKQTSLMVGILGVWACSGFVPSAVSAAEPAAPLHEAAGEIVWLDVPLGQLQLRADGSTGTRTTAAYNITEHETRVTDRLDKQFLTIADLRAGQRVAMESRDSGEAQLATKITVEPMLAPLFQQAEGTIASIDSNPGTFTLNETTSTAAAGTVSLFVFDPKDIVVMESPSLQPVRLEVTPGDFVRVEYVVIDGQRSARSMMRYAAAPAPTSTTTTVTTRTTTTRP